uniref:SRCR domain-containing protein n=1 Tax=Strongyloides papillosus TaxID=174720 RepID=A0A0N5B1X2_STREA
MDPPSLPKENMNNGKFRKLSPFSLKRNGCVRKKPTPPPLPPRQHGSVKKGNLPQLPLKHYRYDRNGHKIIIRSESKFYYTVKSYTIGGMKFYECNHITFNNQIEAKQYCQIINNQNGLKNGKNLWEYTPIIGNSRKSISRSSSDLTHTKYSTSENNDSLLRRKSSSGSGNSLSESSRSSSIQSLTESNSNFSLKRHSISKSIGGSLRRRNSLSISRGV